MKIRQHCIVINFLIIDNYLINNYLYIFKYYYLYSLTPQFTKKMSLNQTFDSDNSNYEYRLQLLPIFDLPYRYTESQKKKLQHFVVEMVNEKMKDYTNERRSLKKKLIQTFTSQLSCELYQKIEAILINQLPDDVHDNNLPYQDKNKCEEQQILPMHSQQTEAIQKQSNTSQNKHLQNNYQPFLAKECQFIKQKKQTFDEDLNDELQLSQLLFKE